MITLRQAVAHVESSGRTSAVRYEPAYTPSPHSQQVFSQYNGWTDSLTIDTLLKSSFGKYQIMADNLYNMINYTKPLNEFWASEAEQDDVFQQFCVKIGFGAYTQTDVTQVPNLDTFARRYNGSIVYATSLLNVK